MTRNPLTKAALWVIGPGLFLWAFFFLNRSGIDVDSRVDPSAKPAQIEPSFLEISQETKESTSSIGDALSEGKAEPAGEGEAPRPVSEATGYEFPRQIQATLLSHPRITPIQAKIGIGTIDDQDLADEIDGANDNRSNIDLVNYDGWIDAPVTRNAFGGWMVGPVTVPEALSYRILAWGDSGYYLEDVVPTQFTPSEVQEVGNLSPTPFTGLKVRILNAGPGQFSLFLSRIPDPDWSEEDSQIGQIMGFIAPEMKKGYAGQAISIEANGQVLAPLYPDPAIRICLVTRAGTRSAWVEVPLIREQINDIALDAASLFGSDPRDLVDLHGKLLFSDGTPVKKATIRMKGQRHHSYEVDNHGRFHILGLSPHEPSTFRVNLPPDTGHRPKSGSRHHFIFNPDIEFDPSEPTEWIIPTYRWLVLGISGNDRLNLEGNPPYPIYILQIKEEDEWKDLPADAFLEEPEGLAISLVRNGTYRGVIAFSPYHFLYSNEVIVNSTEQEVHIPVDLRASTTEGNYHLQLVNEDRPLGGVLVSILGDHTSLPPKQGITNSEGILKLGNVNSGILFITISATEYEVQLAEVENYEILIELEPRQ